MANSKNAPTVTDCDYYAVQYTKHTRYTKYARTSYDRKHRDFDQLRNTTECSVTRKKNPEILFCSHHFLKYSPFWTHSFN